MNKKMVMLRLGFAVVLLLAGCSKKQNTQSSHGSDAVALQGKWTGREVEGGPPGSPSLALSGDKLEFHGGDTNEWYKATFTLQEDLNPKQIVAVITACPFPQYVGKASKGIYRIENGTLTITANEPGIATAPLSFDAKDARQLVFTAVKP